jgi:hypothetical protein
MRIVEKSETTTIEGNFIFKRFNLSTELNCQSCNTLKKTKIQVTWLPLKGEIKTICNGCFKALLSK